MCGIAGILYADRSRPVERGVLKAMGDSLAHRGPDAEGFWEEPGLGLVHRRLSIIDLAGGDQPIGNEDGTIQVVFNGEIYNYQGLRADLVARGHRFTTQSDTEILVHLYEELGERLTERLRGMFAFALWDQSERRLLLARDRLGIKPLYIYRDAEKLLFGSELKAILVHPEVSRNLNIASLEDYLTYGMVPGDQSIFARVEKLLPGHSLLVQADNLTRSPRRYWQLKLEPDLRPTAEQWQEEVRAKLEESVRIHLMADVPVGAFLSGGVDSGVVVGLGARGTNGPLRTFSIGFEEEAFSELPAARLVAERHGTIHAEEIVTPDAAALVEKLTYYFDEPFADSSAVPTYLVAQMASHSVKVVLSGDGGDEAFGGYARYVHDLREAAVRRWLPGWFRRVALAPLARVYPKADWLPRPWRAKTGLTNLSLEPANAYVNSLSLCRLPLRRRLLAPDIAMMLAKHEPGRIIRQAFASASPGDSLGGMIAADLATFLPDDYLVKVDRASMASGVEVRPPLLDHELMELAARIPSSYKVRRGQTKWIFKKACGDLLPIDVLRRPKQGFEIPIDSWFRGPLREMFESAVLAPQSNVRDLVDQQVARRLIHSHVAGAGRHGGTLWGLLMLACWVDRYLSSSQSPSPSRVVKLFG
jgi:asparagine synthase (glutamine-hydrolysing)